MWANLALQGVGFLNKRRQARNAAAWDRYNNAMAGIQAGQANNAISVNVARNRAQDTRSRVEIEKSRLMAAAKVKAGAAAAGVGGRAVEDTLFDLGRNAGNRLHQQAIQFSASLENADHQREGVAMQRNLSQRQVTQGPSLLGALSVAGLNILDEATNEVGSNGTNLEGGQTTEPAGPLQELRNMLSI